MWALIYKDFLVAVKQFKFMLIMLIVFAVCGTIFSTSSFFTTYPILYSAMLTIPLISLDETCKWNTYVKTLPFPREAYVTAKYITCGVILLAYALLMSLSYYIGLTVTHSFLFEKYIMTVLLSPALGLLFMSFILPPIFRFGTVKGRMISPFIIALIIVAAVLLSGVNDLLTVLYAIILISPIAYVISWLISKALYKNRETS